MTEESTPTPRPVSLAAVAAIFVLLALFGFISDRVYARHRAAAPQNETADNLSKDMQWKATPETRRAYLAELREKHAKQGASYGWVDQKNGVVQLPIERAMELVVAEYKAPAPQAPAAAPAAARRYEASPAPVHPVDGGAK